MSLLCTFLRDKSEGTNLSRWITTLSVMPRKTSCKKARAQGSHGEVRTRKMQPSGPFPQENSCGCNSKGSPRGCCVPATRAQAAGLPLRGFCGTCCEHHWGSTSGRYPVGPTGTPQHSTAKDPQLMTSSIISSAQHCKWQKAQGRGEGSFTTRQQVHIKKKKNTNLIS